MPASDDVHPYPIGPSPPVSRDCEVCATFRSTPAPAMASSFVVTAALPVAGFTETEVRSDRVSVIAEELPLRLPVRGSHSTYRVGALPEDGEPNRSRFEGTGAAEADCF